MDNIGTDPYSFKYKYNVDHDISGSYSSGNTEGLICSGRAKFISNGEDDYDVAFLDLGPSRHLTYVFNIFVMMTCFNFLNARKIKDELNIMEGIFRNSLFIIIVIFIFLA